MTLKPLELSLSELVGVDTQGQRKQWAALLRAVPVTRMVDYGVPLGDAIRAHAEAASEDLATWDEVCEKLALRHTALAQAASRDGQQLTAAQAWRSASALLQCAQLAFNEDQPRKQSLYENAHDAMAQHASLSDDMDEVKLSGGTGELKAWVVRPQGRPACAAVVVLGGLSGWGAAYLDMGRALAARGLLALLSEGPGQGLTRMHAGLYLGNSSLPLLSRFVDHAKSLSSGGVGVWGNSFGGLFAAHLAVRDERVQALCVNGAPMVPTLPGFRTAREQLAAVLGAKTDEDLIDRIAALALDPQRHCTKAPILVVEGGCDPLVPLGSQHDFFALSPSTLHSLLTWSDGEHTIYNHAQERNARVADWFASRLAAGPINAADLPAQA